MKCNVLFASDYIAQSPGAFIRSLEILSEMITKGGGKVAYLFSEQRDYLNILSKYGDIYICKKTANRHFSIAALLNMAHALKKIKADVIHIQFLGFAYLLSAIVLKFFCTPKIVVHYRNPPVSLLEESKIYHKFSPLFYYLLNIFFIDANIVISDSIREMLVKNYFAPPEKISVIYNGIDPNIVKSDYTSARKKIEAMIKIPLTNRFVIGMIANFSPQKDHITVIKAASILIKRHPSLLFLFVGSEKFYEGTGYMEIAKNYVAKNGLENYVYFTGEVKDVYEIIPGFEIGLLISNFEGFGNALVECGMAGKPIIGTAIGGIKEIIEDGNNGLLIEPGDYKGLAEKIELLLTDDSLRNEIGERSKKVALEKFSVGTWVKNVIALYEKIVCDK